MDKICPRCRKKKDKSEFGFRNKEKTRIQSSCKQCMRLYRVEHYHGNKQQYKDRNAKSKKRNRALYIKFLKGKTCVDCSENDPIVLEFDHIKGIKKKCVSRMIREGYGEETIRKEFDKCEIRCANCHRRKTAKEQGWLNYYKG